jgi:hypothetical protein
VLLDLQRALGLRFQESAKLDARAAYAEALETGLVTIVLGTKGGRERVIPATEAAMVALEKATMLQAKDRSMIPTEMSYASFQSLSYRQLRAAIGKGTGFHAQRHGYAQERYQTILGAPPPVVAGWRRSERMEQLAKYLGISLSEAKAKDEAARLQIAFELGHGRVEVTNEYLG